MHFACHQQNFRSVVKIDKLIELQIFSTGEIVDDGHLP